MYSLKSNPRKISRSYATFENIIFCIKTAFANEMNNRCNRTLSKTHKISEKERFQMVSVIDISNQNTFDSAKTGNHIFIVLDWICSIYFFFKYLYVVIIPNWLCICKYLLCHPPIFTLTFDTLQLHRLKISNDTKCSSNHNEWAHFRFEFFIYSDVEVHVGNHCTLNVSLTDTVKTFFYLNLFYWFYDERCIHKLWWQNQ